MVTEELVEYDKWGNMNYLASADGHGKLIDNSQSGWAVKRWVYDIKGNITQSAVFDKDNKPCVGQKEEYHKITHTYNRQNRQIETRYYLDPSGLRQSGYAIERYKYNEQGQIIELTLFN